MKITAQMIHQAYNAAIEGDAECNPWEEVSDLARMRYHTMADRLNERIEQQDELLYIEEVAQLLRVDDTTVRRWVKLGALDAIILPHLNTRQGYRIRRSTVNRLLDSTNG